MIYIKAVIYAIELLHRFVQYLDKQQILDDAAKALWTKFNDRLAVKHQMSEAARQRLRDELARSPDDVRAPDPNERTD